MGRRKIEIAPITEERNRQVTFVKRKQGLMKKAYELGVLCNAEVALIVFAQNGKAYQFTSTGNIEKTLIRYSTLNESDVETKGPADFGGIAGGSHDDDFDDDADDLPRKSEALSNGSDPDDRMMPNLNSRMGEPGSSSAAPGQPTLPPIMMPRGPPTHDQSYSSFISSVMASSTPLAAHSLAALSQSLGSQSNYNQTLQAHLQASLTQQQLAAIQLGMLPPPPQSAGHGTPMFEALASQPFSGPSFGPFALPMSQYNPPFSQQQPPHAIPSQPMRDNHKHAHHHQQPQQQQQQQQQRQHPSDMDQSPGSAHAPPPEQGQGDGRLQSPPQSPSQTQPYGTQDRSPTVGSMSQQQQHQQQQQQQEQQQRGRYHVFPTANPLSTGTSSLDDFLTLTGYNSRNGNVQQKQGSEQEGFFKWPTGLLNGGGSGHEDATEAQGSFQRRPDSQGGPEEEEMGHTDTDSTLKRKQDAEGTQGDHLKKARIN